MSCYGCVAAREPGCGGRLRSDDARGMNPLLYQAELHRENEKARRANRAGFKNSGRVLLLRSSHVATGGARLLRGDVQRRVAAREDKRPLQSTAAILIAPHCGVQALSDRVARDAHAVLHPVGQAPPHLPMRNPHLSRRPAGLAVLARQAAGIRDHLEPASMAGVAIRRQPPAQQRASHMLGVFYLPLQQLQGQLLADDGHSL